MVRHILTCLFVPMKSIVSKTAGMSVTLLARCWRPRVMVIQPSACQPERVSATDPCPSYRGLNHSALPPAFVEAHIARLVSFPAQIAFPIYLNHPRTGKGGGWRGGIGIKMAHPRAGEIAARLISPAKMRIRFRQAGYYSRPNTHLMSLPEVCLLPGCILQVRRPTDGKKKKKKKVLSACRVSCRILR